MPGEGWAEDRWVGPTLRVGTATLAPEQGYIRCTMVTREQPGIDEDRDVFRTLARHHGARFGVWCGVIEPGGVAVGDTAAVSMRDGP